MQVTKGTWCMYKQCVPDSLSFPAREPGIKANTQLEVENFGDFCHDSWILHSCKACKWSLPCRPTGPLSATPKIPLQDPALITSYYTHLIDPAPVAAKSPVPQGEYVFCQSLVCVVEMYDNCNLIFFWIGATPDDSIKNLQRYIFGLMSQFVNLTRCGVPHHPLVAVQTGDEYCLTVLHHLSLNEYMDHLTKEFSGVLGTRNNNWPQATSPLGFLVVHSFLQWNRAGVCRCGFHVPWNFQIPMNSSLTHVLHGHFLLQTSRINFM